jgi:hypothetical protein
MRVTYVVQRVTDSSNWPADIPYKLRLNLKFMLFPSSNWRDYQGTNSGQGANNRYDVM